MCAGNELNKSWASTFYSADYLRPGLSDVNYPLIPNEYFLLLSNMQVNKSQNYYYPINFNNLIHTVIVCT